MRGRLRSLPLNPASQTRPAFPCTEPTAHARSSSRSPAPAAYPPSVTGLSYLLQLSAARLLRLPLPPLLPAPLPLALASFVPFALDVPATSSFSFLGVRASEKAFVYLSGLQLLLAIGRRGLTAGGLCLVAGLLHRANFLGLRKLQVRGREAAGACRAGRPVRAAQHGRRALAMAHRACPSCRHARGLAKREVLRRRGVLEAQGRVIVEMSRSTVVTM
jgi:hypothetical protein